MKAVIQRVKNASCTVDGTVTGTIDSGLLVYFGVDKGEDTSVLQRFLEKIVRLRCFEDDNGKMNLSIMDKGASILFISQFTLSADVYHGNRPSFDSAEEPEKAKSVYEKGIAILKNLGINVQCGIFGAHMEISYINDGPVTFVLDSACFSHRS